MMKASSTSILKTRFCIAYLNIGGKAVSNMANMISLSCEALRFSQPFSMGLQSRAELDMYTIPTTYKNFVINLLTVRE